ncbi:MAG: ribosome biogenesis GTP-binding protein YihA/YsxC [Thiohalocapsa sp.]|uniref:ribosome biogenesis GTP-binding protein YihA/YsxC n=1 Tax=Thiohalocapsa sp. TaxID=2497641 RepID=UPI0025DDFBD1|nr:ribosome biogenesis GTP-binding protein YihA/YsxC [Thiohalocapsa sp.]MCG6940432.1 ribosome biogenesis GTP-binding protein YihA/YsxC [Thiohalocapsa sp.]
MHPDFQRAGFLTAATSRAGTPPDAGFEVAFAGRSNAGKSSAINRICHQRGLARTSRTPGRTQQLVFFRLDDERRLVDLPGYGFAKVSLAVKAGWQALMEDYLRRRQCLQGLVVVMDIRHPLTDIDRHMLAWGRAAELPMLLLLTKADKLKRGAQQRQAAEVHRRLAELEAGQGQRAEVAVEVFSAENGLGVARVQARLGDWLGLAAR